MSKWLVPLIIAGLVGALVLIGLNPSPRPAELVKPTATEVMEPQPIIPPDLDDADLGTFLFWATRQGGGAYNRFGGFKFASLTYEATQESADLFEVVLERLRSYDLSAYPASDQLNARIYMFELESRIGKCRLVDHEYLINSYVVNYPATAEDLCTAMYMVWDEQGIADHLDRISVLEARYDELIERLRRSEAIGAIPTRADLLTSAAPLRESAECVPTEHPIYTAFADHLATIEGLSQESREKYEAQMEELLATSILPATARVADYVEALAERAPEDGGVWRHAGGDEYYRFMLRYYATTLLPPDEIHQLGLREVDRLRGEIFEVANMAGLTEIESLPALFDEVAEQAGSVSGEETVAYCEQLVTDMRARIAGVFNQLPQRELTVESGDSEGFYSPASGAYTVPSGVEKSRHEIATVTYHEGLPGHHLQKSLLQELDLPPYRGWILYNAYSEGWALYAERLAWELGAYESDPYGNLGRLQYELLRAVRLVVDTGLHAKQWSSQQAFDYMWENTGLDEQMIRDEIARYLVAPGQAVSYLIGLHTLLDARDRAMEVLGEDFELAEFHDAILGAGEIPLPFIDDVVDVYVEEKLAEG